MKGFNAKNTAVKVLGIILALALVVGAAFGITALVKKETGDKVTVNADWKVGGLTDYGKYEKTDKSIYTHKAIECQGLDIRLNFDSTIDYEVFFYDEKDEFISKSEKMETAFSSEDVPSNAFSCRIVVSPNWEKLGVEKADEQKIGWFGINKYVKQLTIKVDKEQTAFLEKALQTEDVFSYQGNGIYTYDKGFSASSSPFHFSNVIDTTGYNTLVVKLHANTIDGEVQYGSKLHPAFALYDLLHTVSYYSTSVSSKLDYELIEHKGNSAYYSINVSNFENVVLSFDKQSMDIIEAYLI